MLMLVLLPTFLVAGEPDIELHEKCLYPTVCIFNINPAIGGIGSGVVIKSTKDGDHYHNIVGTCAHVLKETPAMYEKVLIKQDGKKIGYKLKLIKPAKYDYKIRVGKYENWSVLVAAADFDCEVLAVDKEIDVALIKFTSKEKMYTVELDINPKLFIGNKIHRVGCGMGEPFRVDYGRITSLANSIGRSQSVVGTHRTSIVTLPGDSGGPVFHENKMIGVAQGIRNFRMNAHINMPIFQMSYVIPLKRFISSEIIKNYVKTNDNLKCLMQEDEECQKNLQPKKESLPSESSSDLPS